MAREKRQNLGRGLDALLGEDSEDYAELDKVRTQLQTAVIAARQTPAGQAEAAGWALINHGDPREAEGEIRRLQAVSAEDVQRVLRRHVLERPAVTVHYRQQPGRQGAGR